MAKRQSRKSQGECVASADAEDAQETSSAADANTGGATSSSIQQRVPPVHRSSVHDILQRKIARQQAEAGSWTKWLPNFGKGVWCRTSEQDMWDAELQLLEALGLRSVEVCDTVIDVRKDFVDPERWRRVRRENDGTPKPVTVHSFYHKCAHKRRPKRQRTSTGDESTAPLVFLPGFGMGCGTAAFFLEDLVRKTDHIDFHSVDWLGCGGSSRSQVFKDAVFEDWNWGGA